MGVGVGQCCRCCMLLAGAGLIWEAERQLRVKHKQTSFACAADLSSSMLHPAASVAPSSECCSCTRWSLQVPDRQFTLLSAQVRVCGPLFRACCWMWVQAWVL